MGGSSFLIFQNAKLTIFFLKEYINMFKKILVRLILVVELVLTYLK